MTHIDTTCVQGGYQPGNGESRTPPIIQATTFKYTSSEQMSRLFDLSESGYFYTRLQNPTNDMVAAKIWDEIKNSCHFLSVHPAGCTIGSFGRIGKIPVLVIFSSIVVSHSHDQKH